MPHSSKWCRLPVDGRWQVEAGKVGRQDFVTDSMLDNSSSEYSAACYVLTMNQLLGNDVPNSLDG